MNRCPDCGEPISLNPSGWWSHDGLPGDCWRLSMDGPDNDEAPDDDDDVHDSFRPNDDGTVTYISPTGGEHTYDPDQVFKGDQDDLR